MMSSEFDGSWILNILITDLQIEKSLRVKGDLHIGGLMLKLVESIEVSADWSDHSFYWSEKSLWLTRAKSTLDQHGVQADAKLWFTPMHKNVQIQLPDLKAPTFRVNFSVNVFSVVIRLCRELGIRHPEELSLMRKLEPHELKRNQGASGTRSANRLPTGMHNPSMSASNPALNEIRTPGTSGLSTPEGTLSRGLLSAHSSPSYTYNANGMQTPGSMDSLDMDASLEGGQYDNIPVLQNLLPKAKNLSEMARLNSAWLDSSRSLMEQDVKEDAILLLRFKFLNFFDLKSKYDHLRIHFIYEQAKSSIISEELMCSEDEMVMFAALQAQVEKQSSSLDALPKHEELSEDEIDSALADLQVSLEGHSDENPRNVTQTPKLKNWLRCCKPRKYHVRTFKSYWFVLRDRTLAIYNNDLEGDDDLLQQYELSENEGFTMFPMCSVSTGRFLIKLVLHKGKTSSELWLRPDHEEQYVKWLAAFRVIRQGRTMADIKMYEDELKSIESLLNMQRTSEVHSRPDLDPSDLRPERLFAPRFLSKSKMKQLLPRTVNANSNMRQMSKVDAQLNYIKAWQMLPLFGFRYFIINLKNSKKEELLGIGTDRLVKMDIKKGEITKTWMYKTITTWSVNWEFKQVQVLFEDDAELAFQCLTAGCKVIHEFIGGYIFLSMRSGDKSQALNEELFHKLTGDGGNRSGYIVEASDDTNVMDDSVPIGVSEDGLEDCIKEGSEESEAFQRKRKKKMMTANERTSASCPINERNVENILDRTLLVTESLQQLLNSYKDELKRVGGGQSLSGTMKVAGIKKRIEIAKKMTKAYVNYQQAIDDIAELGRSEEELDEEDYDEEEYYDDGFGKERFDELEADSDAAPVKSHRAVADERKAQKKSEPPRNYPAPSRFSEFDDSDRSWREEMVAAKENKYWYGKDGYSGEELSYGTNVSDDLWMSCEPGSDDETIYNVGFPKFTSRK